MHLSFFAWGDTHFGYEQQFYTRDFRAGIIEQMNNLPGWPFPRGMGGKVAEPDFVMHCGDYVNESATSDHDYFIYQNMISRLRFPHYETQGNHGEGEEHLLAFDGLINWADFARAVQKIGYRGAFVFEFGCIESSPEFRERLVLAIQQLKQLLHPDTGKDAPAYSAGRACGKTAG